MSRVLRLFVVFALFIPPVTYAAPADAPALKTVDVPASGRWTELIPNGTVVAAERLKAGKLRFRDKGGRWHYCTAQLTSSYDGTGSDPTDSTLLLTAAHCVRPGFTEFTFSADDASGVQDVIPVCITRNTKWIDPDSGQTFDPFINARFDYAFLKIPTQAVDPFNIRWAGGDWSNDAFENDLILEDDINVIGIPATGTTLSKLSSGTIKMRPDFYHRKLNTLSTSDASFTKGTSGGAWLKSDEIVSITSSYIGMTSNTGVGAYVTIYGPILHDDAHRLAVFTEQSTQVSSWECRE
jgi:hypothetical protein